MIRMNELKECLIGELHNSGIAQGRARTMVEKAFECIKDPEVPTSAQFGWLWNAQDGFWHWSAEKPSMTDDPGETARVATNWEKFLFNKFGNTSEKIMLAMAIIL